MVSQWMIRLRMKRRMALVGLLLIFLIGVIVSDFFVPTGLSSSGLSAPTIIVMPSDPTASPSATFRYLGSHRGEGFRCSLDVSTFSPCAPGGITYRGLTLGTHSFGVEATFGSATSPATRFSWAILPTVSPPKSVPTTTSVPSTSGVTSGPTTASTAVGGHTQLASGADFAITADLPALLYPGTSQKLDLVFTNPDPSTITIDAGAVAITISTTKAGCEASVNFAVIQGLIATVTIPAGQTRSLSQLGIDQIDWPVVAMVDTDSNQDACQAAPLTLHYEAGATG